VQKDLRDDHIYDRFRHRLMFPVYDAQGRIIGFGGRTLGNDPSTSSGQAPAKYLNSSESVLYHKSSVLFGMHLAKEAMREAGSVIVVEGYFDVLACQRVGMKNVVASCGTALTEEHARLLKRYVDRVILCLDQDRAGREAAERAFSMCAHEELDVQCVVLPEKDPADMAVSDPAGLHALLSGGTKPYLSVVLQEISAQSLEDSGVRMQALRRILGLVQALPLAVERNHYLREAAQVFNTSETAITEDFNTLRTQEAPRRPAAVAAPSGDVFSSVEIAVGLFILYPSCRALLAELIVPEEGFAAALHAAVQQADANASSLEEFALPPELQERARILLLYLEEQGMTHWTQAVAPRELRRNCITANREYLRRKQQGITKSLIEARRQGDSIAEGTLSEEYVRLLQLSKKSQ
jgi:DNA primase